MRTEFSCPKGTTVTLRSGKSRMGPHVSPGKDPQPYTFGYVQYRTRDLLGSS